MLNHEIKNNNEVTINFDKQPLSEEQKRYLKLLFAQFPEQTKFKSYKSFKLLDPKNVTIKLSNSILKSKDSDTYFVLSKAGYRGDPTGLMFYKIEKERYKKLTEKPLDNTALFLKRSVKPVLYTIEQNLLEQLVIKEQKSLLIKIHENVIFDDRCRSVIESARKESKTYALFDPEHKFTDTIEFQKDNFQKVYIFIPDYGKKELTNLCYEQHDSEITRAQLDVYLQCLFEIKNIHNKGYAHLDIKPENFAVSANREYTDAEKVKLIDFGDTLKFNNDDKKLHGTKFYASPEMLSRLIKKDPKDIPTINLAATDIYSLAILFCKLMGIEDIALLDLGTLEILSSKDQKAKEEGYKKLQQSFFNHNTWKKAFINNPTNKNQLNNIRQLIFEMISYDPNSRPKIDDCVNRFKNELLQMNFMEKIKTIKFSKQLQKDVDNILHNISSQNYHAKIQEYIHCILNHLKKMNYSKKKTIEFLTQHIFDVFKYKQPMNSLARKEISQNIILAFTTHLNSIEAIFKDITIKKNRKLIKYLQNLPVKQLPLIYRKPIQAKLNSILPTITQRKQRKRITAKTMVDLRNKPTIIGIIKETTVPTYKDPALQPAPCNYFKTNQLFKKIIGWQNDTQKHEWLKNNFKRSIQKRITIYKNSAISIINAIESRQQDHAARTKLEFAKEVIKRFYNLYNTKIDSLSISQKFELKSQFNNLVEGLVKIISKYTNEKDPKRALEIAELYENTRVRPTQLMVKSLPSEPTTNIVKVVYLEEPIYNLTEKQIKDYLRIFTNNPPQWFTNLPLSSRLILQNRLEKFKTINVSQKISAKTIADFNKTLGTVSSTHRLIPGLANLARHVTIGYDQNGNEIYKKSTIRSSLLYANGIKNNSEAQKITQDNIDQVLQLSQDYDKEFTNEWGVTRTTTPILLHSELNKFPGIIERFSPDKLSIKDKLVNQYIKRLRRNKKYNMLNQNISINSFRDTFLSKSCEKFKGEYSLATLKSVGDFFFTINSSPKISKYPILANKITKLADILHKTTIDKYPDLLNYLNREMIPLLDSLSTKHPDDKDIKQLNKLKQICHTIQAYVKINQTKYHYPYNDSQLCKIALKFTLFDLIGGVTQNSCKSGKDRGALHCMYFDIFNEFYARKNRYPNLNNMDDRNTVASYFTPELLLHHAYNAEQNAIGCLGLKSYKSAVLNWTKWIFKGLLPKYITDHFDRNYPGFLEEMQKSANLNRPKALKKSKLLTLKKKQNKLLDNEIRDVIGDVRGITPGELQHEFDIVARKELKITKPIEHNYAKPTYVKELYDNQLDIQFKPTSIKQVKKYFYKTCRQLKRNALIYKYYFIKEQNEVLIHVDKNQAPMQCKYSEDKVQIVLDSTATPKQAQCIVELAENMGKQGGKNTINFLTSTISETTKRNIINTVKNNPNKYLNVGLKGLTEPEKTELNPWLQLKEQKQKMVSETKNSSHLVYPIFYPWIFKR